MSLLPNRGCVLAPQDLRPLPDAEHRLGRPRILPHRPALRHPHPWILAFGVAATNTTLLRGLLLRPRPACALAAVGPALPPSFLGTLPMNASRISCRFLFAALAAWLPAG